MAMDLGIFSLLGGVAQGIGSLFKPKAVSGFTSEAEYNKAYQEYRDAVKRGDTKRITEMEPAIFAWQNQKEQAGLREEQRGTAINRLTEGQARGEKAIVSNLYSRGLRGKGELYSPVEDLRRQVSEQKADIAMGRRQEEMNTKQQLQMANVLGNLQSAGADVDNISSGIGLGLSTVGEFRPGGAFGGETEWEKWIKKQSNPQTDFTKVMGSRTYGQGNSGYGNNNKNSASYIMGYKGGY